MSDDNKLQPISKGIEAEDLFIEPLASDEEDEEELEALKSKTSAILATIKKQNNPWGMSAKGAMARNLAVAKASTKNGMYARIPLVCKGGECPYADQCTLLPYDMAPEGEYCAVELAQIDIRSIGYANDIGYDEASFTDKNLVSELIMLDIMLERCKALLSKEGTPVIDMSIGVDQDGNEIRQPAVSKAWEVYEKVSKKRDQTYQLLLMTRKDKANKDTSAESQNISKMLQDVIDNTIVDAI